MSLSLIFLQLIIFTHNDSSVMLIHKLPLQLIDYSKNDSNATNITLRRNIQAMPSFYTRDNTQKHKHLKAS